MNETASAWQTTGSDFGRNLDKLGRKRPMRRSDEWSFALPGEPLKTGTTYRNEFKTPLNSPRFRAKPITHQSEGKGWEVFTHCNLENRLPPETSIYRSDFLPGGGRTSSTAADAGSCPAEIRPKSQLVGSTSDLSEYQSNYHTWFTLPTLSETMERSGDSWRPKPAVYVAEDAARREPMATATSYNSEYVKLPILRRRESGAANLESTITRLRILNGGESGKELKPPKSLYMDTYVGQRGADNWAYRRVRQHPSAVAHTVAHGAEDGDYWRRVFKTEFPLNPSAVYSDAHQVTEPDE
ncbi:Nitrogen permease regulator 2 [Sparganum proliferum]